MLKMFDLQAKGLVWSRVAYLREWQIHVFGAIKTMDNDDFLLGSFFCNTPLSVGQMPPIAHPNSTTECMKVESGAI
jgi:hypothetical protein